MNPARPSPYNLQNLPTLTEVIEMPAVARAASDADGVVPDAMQAAFEEGIQVAGAAPAVVPDPGEPELVERVLADLLRQADLMLEFRLREALAPALARLTDTLVRDLRQELAATLRDVVARAVAQELARRRNH